MIKRMLIMLVLVGVVLGSVFGFKTFVDGKIKQFMSGMGNQPQTVSTTKAALSDWQPELEAVGSLRAVNGADLSLEVPGVVEELNFQSGDDVEQGKVLLRLRDEDEVAKLKSLEAVADLSQITYERDLKQFAAKAVAQAIVDNDAANLRNSRAQVAQQKAIVDKKSLRAPFSGHLGVRQVDVGQYLAAGAMIVTLQALDPIYADFLLPQQSLDKIASVDIDVGTVQRLVTLPQTAISYNPYGNLVYLVDDKGKGPDGKPMLVARQTFVTTGATRGDQVSVLKGIKEGDTIVTGGQMKLRNGVPLAINNKVLLKDDPNPRPLDN